MNRVGLALVGAGPWGRTLGRAVMQLPDVDLRWICELDSARRADAGALAPRARLTGALDEVLADPGVQGALVAVDSPRHHAVGLRVLDADRHLLVEKPMALTVADARELHTLAHARGRVLAVDHLLLHHPAIRRARLLMSEGALGQPLWLEATRFATGRVRPGQSVWWALAPHDVSLALHLFEAVPVAVTAVGGGARPSTGGDDAVVWATLHFGDGRLAHIRVARQAAEKKRQFTIVGDRGSMIFDELSPDRALRIQPVEGPLRAESFAMPAADPLSAQCRQFIHGVVRDDPTAGNGAHALAVVRVLEAGTRSMAANGAPIGVD